MRFGKIKITPIVIFTLFLLSSCLGISAEIRLNNNGSGTIDLQYQVSKSLDSLGRLDGNERWHTIPLGRADFERTLERLPDLKLLSFSSTEDERNINFSVRMEFSSIQGLMAFLDAGGNRSRFTGDHRSGSIFLTLSEGRGEISPNLDSLLSGISQGYNVRLGMRFPGEGTLNISDLEGAPVDSGFDIVRQGRRVSASIPLYDILSAEKGINLEFSWP